MSLFPAVASISSGGFVLWRRVRSTGIPIIFARPVVFVRYGLCARFQDEINNVLLSHRRETMQTHVSCEVFQLRKLLVLKSCDVHIAG